MSIIRYQNKLYAAEQRESVLDTLLRHGVGIPNSCRSGACQTCMMQAISGSPSTKSQEGLRDTLRAQHYFLSCMCVPEADIEVSLPDESVVHRVNATVIDKRLLNGGIVRLHLRPESEFAYRPGQFLHLHHPSGLVRSYSIASVPELNEPLEIHIRRIPGGIISNWAHDDLTVGEQVTIAGPAGNCFYAPHSTDQPILFAGTGSGLAPLYGVLRDALEHGHTGPMILIHGALNCVGLYLVDELLGLAAAHSNFTYMPAILHESAPEGGFSGKIEEAVAQAMPNPANGRIYLCGDPGLVNSMKRQLYLAGASLKNIYSDPFVMAK